MKGILWGTLGPDSQNIDSGLELALGLHESLVHLAQPWVRSGQYQSFPQNLLQQSWDRGALVLLDWASWDLSNQTDPMYGLDKVISGNHDQYIHTWAQAALAWGHPFVLRFDAEMNGGWESYGAQPNPFAKAWQHVVDVFRAEKATNVSWHWCPNVTAPPNTQWPTSSDKLSAYYPGDNYVDWTGFDTYNWSSGNGGPWMSFDQIMNGYPGWLGPTYDTITKIAPNKPMCIGEFGCWDDPRKGAWLSDALSKVSLNYPLVRAISYFNWAAGGPWPLGPDAIPSFKAGLQNGPFVMGGKMTMPPPTTIVPYEIPLPRPEPSNPDVPWDMYQQVVTKLGISISSLSDTQARINQWKSATDNLRLAGG